MKKYSKLFIAAIVALIFIGTFVFLWRKSQPKPIVYNEFTPVVTDISKTTIITGKIEPRNEVNVKPQISGIITELLKEAGDYVNAGDVIAKVKVIPDMSQLSSAESRVRLAALNLVQAKVDFSREENLYNQKLVSAEEFDKVKQALKQAREEKLAAEDALAVVRDGVSKSNAKASSTLIRSTISGIAEKMGADSLGFLPVTSLDELNAHSGCCKACFTGEYPTEVPAFSRKDKYDRRLSETLP